MTQSPNQFEITNEKGLLTLAENLNAFDCRVKTGESTALVPGQAVKLDASGRLIVTSATAATDAVFGFVISSSDVSSYAADEMVKIAVSDCVMIMEASAAISSGAEVQIVPTGQKVVTKTTGTLVGRALEAASADGDLIAVLIATV